MNQKNLLAMATWVVLTGCHQPAPTVPGPVAASAAASTAGSADAGGDRSYRDMVDAAQSADDQLSDVAKKRAQAADQAGVDGSSADASAAASTSP